MYDLYYNVLKSKQGKEVSLVYMDTDSFLLDFKNVDFHDEMKNGGPRDLMGLSIFPVDHDLYSDEKKGELELLKSETAGRPIVEAIGLAPQT